MPSGLKSSDDADDAVSVVSSVAEESDDSSDNTKWIIILTSLVMAIAFPTLLYFFAPYQLITVGSALLNSLTIQASITATLITGALVIGTGVFTVFSLIGATISYIFEDAKPAETLIPEEHVKKADLEEEAPPADATTAAEETYTLPAAPGVIAAASATPALLPTTAPGAAPAPGTVAAGATATGSAAVVKITVAASPPSAIRTTVAGTPPLTPPPPTGAVVTDTTTVPARRVTRTKQAAAAPQPTEDTTVTVDTPTTKVTAYGDIPVAIRDALNTAKKFVIQHPAACFGGASLVLVGMYRLASIFSGNDSTAAVGVGSTILSMAVDKVLTPLVMVTCLYQSLNKTMHVPVPGVCPDGSTLLQQSPEVQLLTAARYAT